MRLRGMLMRDGRAALRGLLPTLLLLALLLPAAALSAASYSAAEGGEGAVRLYLVDEDDTELSRLAVTALKSQRFVTASLTIERAAREPALAALDRGEGAAVLVLPPGYLEAILTGEPYRAELFVSQDLARHAEVVEELVKAGETMMSAGQTAIFSGEALLTAHAAAPSQRQRFLEGANGSLLAAALWEAEEGVQVRLLPYADTDLGLREHYLVTWLSLALSLGPFFLGRLWRRDLAALPRLCSAGVGHAAFVAPKLLLSAGARLMVLSPTVLLLGLRPGPGAWCLAGAACLFGALLDGGFMLGLGEMAVPLGFALAGAGLFLAGGIYPRRLLPRALVLLSRLTPLGALRGLLGPLFGGACGLWELGAALVWAAAALALLLRGLHRALWGGEGT